ncbi:MAG TPA: hypothetical protein VFN53_05410 [Acidobacteriaceae bacterium]|nr:hypothetical protein [Acidobacteriaceae bacterium]
MRNLNRASCKSATVISARFNSRFAFLLPALAWACIFLVSGCGGGGPVYVAGNPCYNYPYGGCPYGYGAISTFAGTNLSGNSGDGGASAGISQLTQPVGLAFDASGNLYVADRASDMVRQVAASTHRFTGALSGSASAESGSQVFHQPSAVALDRSGRLYVLDQGTSTVRRFSQSRGAMVLVAGNPGTSGGYSGDNGPAIHAQLNHPAGMVFDRAGNLFIADTLNHRVRKLVSATGTIVTVAGSGTAGYSGDGGPAAAAQLSRPSGVAIDSDGNLYIADASASVIRKVDARSGMISTVAGTGKAGFSGDGGPAAAAQLDSPQGVTVDAQGNLFIADTGNQRIRELAAHNGIITTIAGKGSPGYSGDGGPSVRAQLNTPYATAIDAAGNLYIADSGNGAVRKVRPDPQNSAAAN